MVSAKHCKNGGRSYYDRDDPFEQTLAVPEEGVKNEWEQRLEYFDKVYTRLQKKKEMIEDGAV